MSSRKLNQDVGHARRAAESGPVFSTNRDEPAHVLLGIGDQRRLVNQQRSLTEALSMEGLADIDFETTGAAVITPWSEA